MYRQELKVQQLRSILTFCLFLAESVHTYCALEETMLLSYSVLLKVFLCGKLLFTSITNLQFSKSQELMLSKVIFLVKILWTLLTTESFIWIVYLYVPVEVLLDIKLFFHIHSTWIYLCNLFGGLTTFNSSGKSTRKPHS